MRLLGLDPGLRRTGWGVIRVEGSRLSHVANGAVATDSDQPIALRLAAIYDGVAAVIALHRPVAAVIEEPFVSRNAASTLKLGQARGAALLAPARAGLPVAEYAANAVKKAVVGVGHADKQQIQMMVRRLLPGVELAGADAADALAVAICHAHHAATQARWTRAEGGGRAALPAGAGG
jgi:crossover junction endodeoxyribonuclease RuvC